MVITVKLTNYYYHYYEGTFMYIKIMKPSGGFQLLECSDYVEIMDRSEDVKEVVYFMKDDESCREWKVEVTGDVYIVNEEGKTVSYYKHN